MAYMLTYIGKDKLAIYEVSASDIVDNIEGTGVILRQENLVNAAQDGYINYYVQDGAMVNKNGEVYMIDTTGEIQDYLNKNWSLKFLKFLVRDFGIIIFAFAMKGIIS